MATEGGHDFVIFGDAPKDVNCCICLLILRDAMEIMPCSHVLCKICIEKLIVASEQVKRTPLCPTCQREFAKDQVRPNGFADRLIKDIKVFCKQHDIGCGWVESISNYKDHEVKCPFKMMPCLFSECGVMVMRRELDEHLKLCVYRLINCEYCGMRFPFIGLKAHNHNECKDFPVKCVHTECQVICPRSQVPVHLEVCSFQEIDCSFLRVGCSVQVPRKDMAKHLQDNIHQHMALHLNKTDGDLKSAKNEVLTLKGELSASNVKVEMLEQSWKDSQDVNRANEVKLREQTSDVERLCLAITRFFKVRDLKSECENSESLIRKMCNAIGCNISVDLQEITNANHRMLLQRALATNDTYQECFDKLMNALQPQAIMHVQGLIIFKVWADPRQPVKCVHGYLDDKTTFDARKTDNNKCFDNDSLVMWRKGGNLFLFILKSNPSWTCGNTSTSIFHPSDEQRVLQMPKFDFDLHDISWYLGKNSAKDFLSNDHLLFCIQREL